MTSKWLSRKFWVALVPEVAGIVTFILGVTAGNLMATIAGGLIAIATALGYLKVEGDIDKANKLIGK